MEISLLYETVIRPLYGNLTVIWNCYETVIRKFDHYKKLLWDRYMKSWLLYETVMRSLKEISLLYDIVIRPLYGNLTVMWNCYETVIRKFHCYKNCHETIIWKFHCYMKLLWDRYKEIWLLYETVMRPL